MTPPNPRAVSFALALACAAAGAAAQPVEESPPRHWGRDRLVDIEHLRLELAVDPRAGTVDGSAELTVAGILPSAPRMELDAVDLDVSEVTVNGRPAAHEHDGEVLGITLLPPLERGKRVIVRVTYSARPRNGLHFVRPDPSVPGKQLQAWSQGESEHNRHWFPVHDSTNERLTSETLIRVEKPLQVVSNGPLLEVTDHGDGTATWHHRLDFPHVPYLVSIAVGDWATKEDEWEGVKLTYHAPRARAGDMDRTFSTTPRILDFISDFTGVKYPFPVYHQVVVQDFMYGGMENITATTLTDMTLHDERAHLDWKSDGLIAHEAAHQWFGDAVTTENWSDAWLNEGFATYYEVLAVGDLQGPEQLVVEIDSMQHDAIEADEGKKRRPVVTNAYEHVDDLFDDHAYAKGAAVLHALRRELGDPAFRGAVQQYLTERTGTSVDTHDLIDSVERATGRDVSRFFQQWIYGAGQPELEADWSWKDGVVTLKLEQVQEQGPLVGLFDVPLDVQLLGDGGADEHAIRLSRKEQTYQLRSAQRPRAVLVDPEGWLLRTLEIDRPARETAWVMAHAPHLRSRLEAARDLEDDAGRPEAAAALREALGGAREWPLRKEAAVSLGSAATAEARVALIAALRGDAESRVRAAAATALGEHGGDDSRRALEAALGGDVSYAVRAKSAAALADIDAPGATAVLERALTQASHRDEVFKAALTGLADVAPERARLLAERWSEAGKPQTARNHAISVLAKLAGESTDEAFRKSTRERLAKLLDDPLLRTRRAAAEGLGVLGDPKALDDLERVAATAVEPRLASIASEAVKKIRESSAAKAKVADLARDLAKEREAREKLERKLKELEARVDELDPEPL